MTFAYYLFLLFRALKKENIRLSFGAPISNHLIFHICFLLYFLVVTGTLSILRTQTGMDTFLLSNHRIFSIMLQFMIVLLLFQQFYVTAIINWIHIGIFLFSMLLFISSLPFMYQNLNRKYAEVFNFYNGKGGLGMHLSTVRKYQIDKNINYLLKNGGLVMPNKINSWKKNHEKLFKNPPLNRKIKLNGEVAIWEKPPLKTYFQEIFNLVIISMQRTLSLEIGLNLAAIIYAVSYTIMKSFHQMQKYILLIFLKIKLSESTSLGLI